MICAVTAVAFISSGPENLTGTHQTRRCGAPGLQRRSLDSTHMLQVEPLNKVDNGSLIAACLPPTGSSPPSGVTPNLYKPLQSSRDLAAPSLSHAQTLANLPSPSTGALVGAIPPLSQAGMALESPQEGHLPAPGTHQGNAHQPTVGAHRDPFPLTTNPSSFPWSGPCFQQLFLSGRLMGPQPQLSSRAPASWTLFPSH